MYICITLLKWAASHLHKAHRIIRFDVLRVWKSQYVLKSKATVWPYLVKLSSDLYLSTTIFFKKKIIISWLWLENNESTFGRGVFWRWAPVIDIKIPGSVGIRLRPLTFMKFSMLKGFRSFITIKVGTSANMRKVPIGRLQYILHFPHWCSVIKFHRFSGRPHQSTLFNNFQRPDLNKYYRGQWPSAVGGTLPRRP